jgi:hypothetical protein
MKITNAASPRHAAQMKALGEFLGLAEIIYTDQPNTFGGGGEDYTLVREDGERLTIEMRGNSWQGAFLCVECGLEPAVMT